MPQRMQIRRRIITPNGKKRFLDEVDAAFTQVSVEERLQCIDKIRCAISAEEWRQFEQYARIEDVGGGTVNGWVWRWLIVIALERGDASSPSEVARDICRVESACGYLLF